MESADNTAHGTHDATPQGAFMKIATTVGDLNSSFYDEERQRDVWNEASAVGFQLMLWLGLIAANLMVWIGGATGLPYALGVFAIVAAASLVAIVYAERLGVSLNQPKWLRRGSLPACGLILAFLTGAVLAQDWSTGGGFFGGLAQGAVAGGAIGGAAAVVGLIWQSRRGRRSRTD